MAIHLMLIPDIEVPEAAAGLRVDFFDNLLVGPSRWSLDEHVDARAADLDAEDADHLRASYTATCDALRGRDDVIIWGSECWAPRIALAFLCSQLADEGRPVTLVDLASRQLDEAVCCGVAISAQGQRVERAQDDVARREATAFWEKFTASDPADFLAAIRSAPVPQAAELASFYADAFPVMKEGTLRLSRLDEALLSSAERSIRVADILTTSSPALAIARRWALCAGDGFVARRLKNWSLHSDAPALRCVSAAGGDLRASYELTAAGRSLLAGLESLDRAPIMAIGGTAAYDTMRPFELLA